MPTTPRSGVALTVFVATVAAWNAPDMAQVGPRGQSGAAQIIVQMDVGASIDDALADTPYQVAGSIDGRNVFLVRVPQAADEQAMLTSLEQNPGVLWAEMNHSAAAPGGGTQSFFVSASAAAFESQPAESLLGWSLADQTFTGAGVTVAVLDTGVSADHPLLSGRVSADGYNFVTNAADTSDTGDGIDNDGDGYIDEMTGHGTFVAGLIAAEAPQATILPVTVLDSDGNGASYLVAEGVYYAIDHGANVINLSLTMVQNSLAVHEAVDAAAAAGVTVVACVGNDNVDQPVSYPAGYDSAIAVAATDESDIKAAFSDYGSYVFLSAPGTGVVGPLPGGAYGTADGASFAAAFVSGAAALVQADSRTGGVAGLRDLLGVTSVDIAPLNPDYAGMLGAGRLNVAALASTLDAAPPADVDLNTDRVVDVFDLLAYLDRWFAQDPTAERTGDDPAQIDVFDLLAYLDRWFPLAAGSTNN